MLTEFLLSPKLYEGEEMPEAFLNYHRCDALRNALAIIATRRRCDPRRQESTMTTDTSTTTDNPTTTKLQCVKDLEG
jgi:hypothetical protein